MGVTHDADLSTARVVKIEQDILSVNNRHADANRRFLKDRGIFTVNFVSSPGSGKTTLLARTITDMKEKFPFSVVEGDQQTENDAERIRATGAAATQVNTGKGCHLDAHMVGHALEHLDPDAESVLFIENVGNLICPSAFDLGEAHKIVVLSVTEGEDKPLKYPDMFFEADLMILNKVDLLPYLSFDVERCMAYAKQVNPDIRILQLSATAGDGLDEWYEWLSARRDATIAAKNRAN
jgi:hydrogenase nickel incorporation protein HypB